MIQKTKNYEMFLKHPNNRPIDRLNLDKITRSIKIRNLLSFRPILVNEKMEVIDGQHRLEAAKSLDLEIHYEVQENLKTHDIILLNDNSKGWSRADYLNYFCQEGFEDYLKLKSFMDRNKINLAMALAVLGHDTGNIKYKERPSSIFKNGRYKFASKEDETIATEGLEKTDEAIAFVYPKMTGYKTFLLGTHFRKAIHKFVCMKEVDFSVFMDKIARRIDIIRACASISQYIDLFKKIYNYNNRNPLSIEGDNF